MASKLTIEFPTPVGQKDVKKALDPERTKIFGYRHHTGLINVVMWHDTMPPDALIRDTIEMVAERLTRDIVKECKAAELTAEPVPATPAKPTYKIDPLAFIEKRINASGKTEEEPIKFFEHYSGGTAPRRVYPESIFTEEDKNVRQDKTLGWVVDLEFDPTRYPFRYKSFRLVPVGPIKKEK